MQVSTPVSRRQFLKRSSKWLLGIGIPLLMGGYSFAIERNWLEVVEFKISLPRLPQSFQGTRIVHFSDLHVGFFFEPNDLQEIVERINRAKPDLILFTGDLIDKEDTLPWIAFRFSRD